MKEIGNVLRAEFDEHKALRQSYEFYWMDGLRQYKGIYDSETYKKLCADKNPRSKVFIRYTRTKVNTINARVKDLAFPAGNQQNWDIEPTPDPEVSPEIKAEIAATLAREGLVPNEQMVDDLIDEVVKERCAAMKQTVADQLLEGGYRKHVSAVIDEGHMLGTGVLKGPLTDTREVKSWKDQGGEYVIDAKEESFPYFEHVPIWSIFPDMNASSVEQLEFCWQRHVVTRAFLRELTRGEAFFTEEIRTYIEEHPHGDAQEMHYEADMRAMVSESKDAYKPPTVRNRYELLERWGTIDGIQLQQWGVETTDLHEEYPVKFWLLGQQVVGYELRDKHMPAIPFNFYYYEKDPNSVFGTHLPEVVEDPQSIINGGIRAMMDHAGNSVGAFFEVNRSLLSPGEDPRLIHTNRVFVREGRGTEAGIPALRVHSLTPAIREFQAIIDIGKTLGDESSSIPSYMHGEQDNGVGKTVGGLSMLMGAANITVKDQVRNFDDGITSPFLKAVYAWNMRFNPDPAIKGDYKVKATASTALVAKEQRSMQVDQFAQTAASNPNVAGWVKWGKVADEMATVRDMDVIKSDEEYRNDMQSLQDQAGEVTPE